MAGKSEHEELDEDGNEVTQELGEDASKIDSKREELGEEVSDGVREVHGVRSLIFARDSTKLPATQMTKTRSVLKMPTK